MRQRHGQVCVHQPQCGVELKERQQEHGWRRHAVGQQPEKHMLVTQEAVATERVGSRQCHGNRDDAVNGHIDQAVDVA